MMKRIILMVTVALVMAAMLVFAGAASAQGGCKDLGDAVSGFAQQFKPFGQNIISGLAPLNDEVVQDQERICV
jgi:hypothetical protein